MKSVKIPKQEPNHSQITSHTALKKLSEDFKIKKNLPQSIHSHKLIDKVKTFLKKYFISSLFF